MCIYRNWYSIPYNLSYAIKHKKPTNMHIYLNGFINTYKELNFFI